MLSEATLAKLRSQAAFTLVTYGDSIMWGERCEGFWRSFLANGQVTTPPRDNTWNSWPNLLARYLQGINPNVTLQNSAVQGQTAAWGLANVAANVNAYSPDLTLVGFGINDWLTSVTVANFESSLTNLVNGITSGEVALIAPTPVANTAYRAWHYPYTKVSSPSAQDAFVDAVVSVAASTGVQVVDPYHMFDAHDVSGWTGADWLNNRGPGWTYRNAEHIGEEGHRMTFELVRRELFGYRDRG